MNRKHFLTTLLPLSLGVKGLTQQPIHKKTPAKHYDPLGCKIPPYLKAGDLIGITCPAGYITLEEVQPAIEQIKVWGLEVSLGSTIGKRDFTYGGTDEERLDDLQQMLDDRKIKAVLCARGGYGAVRIIDKINFASFIKHPKWVIGFSDITVFHSHIHQQLHIATIHSKMCNSFPSDWSKADAEQQATILSIKEVLAGTKMMYQVAGNDYNVYGKTKGVLIGGNLKTIESLSASNSDIDTRNKILFVEDTGEYLYSIDRMFWNLKRSHKLEHLAGLIIGGFKAKEDTAGEPFGKTLYEIVSDKIKGHSFPVCFDFPVGHQRNNYALKCGVIHEFTVSQDGALLKESGAVNNIVFNQLLGGL